MKKFTSVLIIAILSMVGFSACDEVEDFLDDQINLEFVDALKAYTGKSLDDVQPGLEAGGYTYEGVNDEDDDFVGYVFTKGNETLMLVFDSETIFAVVRMIEDETSKVIEEFEATGRHISLYSLDKDLVFFGRVSLDDGEDNTFEDRDEYMAFYNDNKDDMLYSEQEWENRNEFIRTNFIHVDLHESFDNSTNVVLYMNYGLMGMDAKKKSRISARLPLMID